MLLQYVFGFQPCPLCILDRVIITVLLIIYLVASRSQSHVSFYTIALVCTLLGIGITSRHLWLLHLPPDLVPDCSPSFHYLMQNFPWNEAFLIMFKSSGECAGQHDAFLGISLPGWTLLAFIIYLFANIAGIIMSKKKGSDATLR